MKYLSLFVCLLLMVISTGFSQETEVVSPNNKIHVALVKSQKPNADEWFLKVNYLIDDKVVNIIPQINLGLLRNDQLFSKDLRLLKTSKPILVNEQYTAIHGKRSQCSNTGNEIVVSFENKSKAKLNIILRAYNDGVAFRYEFPEKEGAFVIEEELTSYSIPDSTKRWLEKFNPANEGLYSYMINGTMQGSWGYPALFNTRDKACWFLIHEADLNSSYCGSKLSNTGEKTRYKITFPDKWNGRGQGDSLPSITLPWKSPWRVIIMGSLADIVESTLVEDVCPPSIVSKTDWIKPGVASWNYWSSNHGTKDYKVVCEFADLAAAMGWTYTLLDWEWDAMSNGGNLEDAIMYITSKGITPLIWYNSGGNHTWVSSTPKDRMLTHANRVEEFTRLKKMGITGVKIDFFESEKQDMIKYYLDILNDAAQYEMMIYFHGCIVPRGWSRTYPHLMTLEGVRGAEWYNNGPEFTTTAPEHNAILPFTRNVVGPMDYTPVTFTNSQFPHITSYGHEMALSVIFESGIQHMADRPEGYSELPDAPRTFLKEIPNAWDDIRLIDGYPGKDIIIARKKNNDWYIGGINADIREKKKRIPLDFLPEGNKFVLTLITDGRHDKDLATQYMVVDKTSVVEVKMLRRGGFAAKLHPAGM